MWDEPATAVAEKPTPAPVVTCSHCHLQPELLDNGTHWRNGEYVSGKWVAEHWVCHQLLRPAEVLKRQRASTYVGANPEHWVLAVCGCPVDYWIDPALVGTACPYCMVAGRGSQRARLTATTSVLAVCGCSYAHRVPAASLGTPCQHCLSAGRTPAEAELFAWHACACPWRDDPEPRPPDELAPRAPGKVLAFPEQSAREARLHTTTQAG